MSRLNINILVLILISLVLSLISAYAIEFVLGHEPCNLCIYQRIPYIVSIVLILNILFFDKFTKNSLIILSIVSLLGSFLAFYHNGVEQHWWNAATGCGDTNQIFSNFEASFNLIGISSEDASSLPDKVLSITSDCSSISLYIKWSYPDFSASDTSQSIS